MKITNLDQLVATIESERHGWERLFQDIKVTSANYELPCKVAKLQDNRTRNRYRDVSPYDHSRVKLQSGPSDYINGSLVQVQTADRQYILSQGPLPTTSGHLWQMVWEQNSKAVIMLNKVIEKGARKCDQYWPLEKNMPKTFDEAGYEVVLVSEDHSPNYIVRTLSLTKLNGDETSRTIHQFHYIAWPDFGVPESPTAFLEFLTCVRNYGVLKSSVGPPVIHCSAGIGRSGTFALVDTCLVFLEKNIPFDIKDTLLEMRKYRMGLIQTPQQLRFSYLAIADCASRLQLAEGEDLKSSSSSDAGSHDSHDEDSAGSDGNHEEKADGDSTNAQENNDGQESKDTRKRHADDDAEATEEKRGKQEDISFQTEHYEPKEHNNNVSDLRRRQRQEKNEATFKKIEEIKTKMKSTTDKQSSWTPYIIGGLIAGVVVGLAVRYWYS